jgi:hypothetical protein
MVEKEVERETMKGCGKHKKVKVQGYSHDKRNDVVVL